MATPWGEAVEGYRREGHKKAEGEGGKAEALCTHKTYLRFIGASTDVS